MLKRLGVNWFWFGGFGIALGEVWRLKMVVFSGFEGSGRGMVLGEPWPFKGVAC